MKVSYLMATYNEADHIAKTVETLHKFAKEKTPNLEIIVVDDGSSDNTQSVLKKLKKQYGLKTCKNNVNMGQGAAFRNGLKEVTGDVVITLDSDLSYPIEDTPKLLKKIDEGYDLVITSPFKKIGNARNVPPLRLLFSVFASVIYSIAVGKILSAYTGVFRAYKTELIKKLEFKTNGFEAQVELIWLAKEKEAQIVEIPSVLTFKRSRKSNFQPFREIKKHLRLSSKILLSRFGLTSFT